MSKSYIIVLSEEEAQSTIAALETMQIQVQDKEPKYKSIIRDFKSVIAKIRLEQRGG